LNIRTALPLTAGSCKSCLTLSHTVQPHWHIYGR